MEFLNDLFFKTGSADLPFALIRITLFIILTILMVWFLWTVLSKRMYIKNEKLPKEFKLKLVFIWSLIIYYVIFSIYLFFFFKRNGIDSFHWGDPRLYLEISAQLIIIIAVILIFIFKQHQLTKELK